MDEDSDSDEEDDNIDKDLVEAPIKKDDELGADESDDSEDDSSF